MKKSTKKAVAIILAVFFVLLNLIHVYWPIYLILEDIENGTLEGTGIEMGALFPWIIEWLSIPLVIAEAAYFIIFRRVKYFDVFNCAVFCAYIFQVLLFNSLLFLS